MIDDVTLAIKKAKNILILTHENPDGDALGSSLGFKMALNKLGKKVSCFCSDSVPAPFAFLPQSETIKNDFLLGDFDLIIILDCGDSRRTGFSDRIKNFSKYKNKIINIDHHPKNDLHRIANINFVDYNASSTAEIVYQIIKSLSVFIDKDIALALLCGLYTDTGSFKHSNTTTKTLQIASELLRRGARLKKITDNVINNKSVSGLRLWGIALSRLQFNDRYKIASSAVTLEDIKSCDATKEDAAGIVNMINNIPGTKLSIFMYQSEDGIIKGSLRTEENNINLTKLAKFFGGGGLKKASGFTINGNLEIKKDNFIINYS